MTIPFHQVVRATTPVFTILIYRYRFEYGYSRNTYLSVVPVIVGVALSTYGDYYATLLGISITFVGALLAAVKTVATNRLQTAGLRLDALQLLHYMSAPACFQACIVASLSGEIRDFRDNVVFLGNFTFTTFLILVLNGFMAFLLNLISFSANKKVGALTMTVAGNVKQILTILLGILLWNIPIGLVNALGISLTLVGGAIYAYVSMSGRGTIDGDLEEGKIRQN